MVIQKTEFKQKIGNPSHWFGDYYLGGSTGSKFILYNQKKVIELKAKTYSEALKEAKKYDV